MTIVFLETNFVTIVFRDTGERRKEGVGTRVSAGARLLEPEGKKQNGTSW